MITKKNKVKTTFSHKVLPDVSYSQEAQSPGVLDHVGMNDVECPIRFKNSSGETLLIPAKCDIGVSLINPRVKGIHMSRLYLAAKTYFEDNIFDLKDMKTLLTNLRVSQGKISDAAKIKLQFDYMLQRSALISDHKGWRYYPITIETELTPTNQVKYKLSFRITYSSTCPCSAALARQLIQEKFETSFSDDQTLDKQAVIEWLGDEKNIAATPHAQRSFASISLDYFDYQEIPHLDELIHDVESVLETPVQTAVKRVDEQEFARLNAQNLMFCEDSARLLKKHFEQNKAIKDFHIYIQHFESLHAHNAVAVATK